MWGREVGRTRARIPRAVREVKFGNTELASDNCTRRCKDRYSRLHVGRNTMLVHACTWARPGAKFERDINRRVSRRLWKRANAWQSVASLMRPPPSPALPRTRACMLYCHRAVAPARGLGDRANIASPQLSSRVEFELHRVAERAEGECTHAKHTLCGRARAPTDTRRCVQHTGCTCSVKGLLHANLLCRLLIPVQ